MVINWISNLLEAGTALLIFASLAILGTIISIFTMLFGGEHDSDHDFGHDVGGDHDADSHGDGHDGGHGIGAWLLLPVISVRGMSLMATGFGALGFITYYFTQKLLFSCLVGMLSGWLFAFAAFMLLRVFMKQQANSLIYDQNLVGKIGVVITSIPENGVGEITLQVPGQGQIARSATSKQPIRTGRSVRITQVVGSAVQVEEV